MKSATPALRPRSYLGLFLGQMLRRPGYTGALAPSSRGLAQMMVRDLGPETGAVVELGGGTGKITEAILGRGIAPERLAVIESNRTFADILRSRFHGVRVLEWDAGRVAEVPLDGVGAVVSGLPMLSIPAAAQRRIVEGAFRLMRPGGVFVQFTYGWRCSIAPEVREAFGLSWEVSPWVWRNLPPARVYWFRREAADRA